MPVLLVFGPFQFCAIRRSFDGFFGNTLMGKRRGFVSVRKVSSYLEMFGSFFRLRVSILVEACLVEIFFRRECLG